MEGEQGVQENPASKKLKKVIAPHQPRNYHEREEAKNRGKFFDYLKFPSGRKKKMPAASLPVEKIETITADVTPPRFAVSQTSRYYYSNYESGLKKEAMDCGVASMFETGGGGPAAAAAIFCKFGPTILINRSTLRSRFEKVKKQMNEAGQNNEGDGNQDPEMFFRDDHGRRIRNSLTSRETQLYLQSIANARDNNNKGMSRKEMIYFISELEGTNMKTAENHYDFLIRANKIPQLKRGERVVSAQATTTNRTAITTAKILRTHKTVALGKVITFLLLVINLFI